MKNNLSAIIREVDIDFDRAAAVRAICAEIETGYSLLNEDVRKVVPYYAAGKLLEAATMYAKLAEGGSQKDVEELLRGLATLAIEELMLQRKDEAAYDILESITEGGEDNG